VRKQERLAYLADQVAKSDKSGDNCKSLAHGPLPTRVVEILGDGKLRIRCPDPGTKEPYTILSYCWGGPQTFATNSASLEARKSGFTLSDLPRTLQDAVEVSQSIGIHHLWIDSMCIVQDSADDKATEIPQMAAYYNQAYLTICASGSTCDSGFLDDRNICKVHGDTNPFSVDLVPMGHVHYQTEGSGLRSLLKAARSLSRSGTNSRPGFADEEAVFTNVAAPLGTLLKSTVFVRAQPEYAPSHEPISTRAWTLQERVLSTRTIFFSPFHAVWESPTQWTSAGGTHVWQDDHRESSLHNLRKFLVKDSPSPTTNETWSLWYDAVEDFTARDMSVPSDKFPAISALARTFGDRTSGEYLAGLWKQDLPRGLLWTTHPIPTPKRADEWRAPSWSWASVDNEVSWRGLPPANAIQLASVQRCEVVPKNQDDLFGEISSATLEIVGVVLVVQPHQIADLVRREMRLPTVQDSKEWREKEMRRLHMKEQGQLGDRETWSPPEYSALLPLFAVPKIPPNMDASTDLDPSTECNLCGLLLEILIDKGQIRRAGTFSTIPARLGDLDKYKSRPGAGAVAII